MDGTVHIGVTLFTEYKFPAGCACDNVWVYPGQMVDEVTCAARGLCAVHTYHAGILHTC